jgi:hypothetical protein
VDVVISVQDGYSLEDVARRLEAAGLERAESLPELGLLTGWADDSQLQELARLEGVATVEAARDFRLPSPDATVQ